MRGVSLNLNQLWRCPVYRTFLVLILLLGVPFGSALALDAKDLQGKWVITAVNGEDDGDRSDVWEFRGDQWIVWSGNRALSPDPFTVSNNTIDLGYAKIKVLEYAGNRRLARTPAIPVAGRFEIL